MRKQHTIVFTIITALAAVITIFTLPIYKTTAGSQAEPQEIEVVGSNDNFARCSTTEVSDEEVNRIQYSLAEYLAKGDRIKDKNRATVVTIPVRFHVINNGTGINNGDVPLSMINAQIQVLNESYTGGTGGAATRFQFALAGVTRTTNAAWFTATRNSAQSPPSAEEIAMKNQLRQGGADTLNIYSTEPAGTVLGWATFPWNYSDRPALDGVVLRFTTLPGGTRPNFNLGDTGTHETGHWMGLFHTFEDGCNAKFGDMVWDTPAENAATYGAPSNSPNTCRDYGYDPVTNFMDYTNDSFMFEFSAGQADRMDMLTLQYRGL